jgi:hypothetical protein
MVGIRLPAAWTRAGGACDRQVTPQSVVLGERQVELETWLATRVWS